MGFDEGSAPCYFGAIVQMSGTVRRDQPGTSRGELGRCGDYRVVTRIGSGGMASVDLAAVGDTSGRQRLVAVKRLFDHLAADPNLRTMFRDEARLAARMRHPNIVETYEIGSDGESEFIVMEYLEGQTLARILRRSMPHGLPVAIVLRVASDVCAGLQYAHGLSDDQGAPLGIVHRDISPQNIFITYSGEVKLVDFGIAKASSHTTRTQMGVLKGKVSYMAPEHAQGDEVDGRADVFSLGVVLYEALTRRRMWGKTTSDLDVLRKLLTGNVPASPAAIDPNLSEEVDRICRKALAVRREDRYQSAWHMKQDLDAATEQLGETVAQDELGAFVSLAFANERARFESLCEARSRCPTGDVKDEKFALAPEAEHGSSTESARCEDVAIQPTRVYAGSGLTDTGSSAPAVNRFRQIRRDTPSLVSTTRQLPGTNEGLTDDELHRVAASGRARERFSTWAHRAVFYGPLVILLAVAFRTSSGSGAAQDSASGDHLAASGSGVATGEPLIAGKIGPTSQTSPSDESASGRRPDPTPDGLDGASAPVAPADTQDASVPSQPPSPNRSGPPTLPQVLPAIAGGTARPTGERTSPSVRQTREPVVNPSPADSGSLRRRISASGALSERK